MYHFNRIWKDLALLQTIETENNFRTWDYPIREEFRQALATIEGHSPVPNISVGLQKVCILVFLCLYFDLVTFWYFARIGKI